MKHAYDENYVSYAMEQMAELCEIATKIDFQDLDYFINDLFIPSFNFQIFGKQCRKNSV